MIPDNHFAHWVGTKILERFVDGFSLRNDVTAAFSCSASTHTSTTKPQKYLKNAKNVQSSHYRRFVGARMAFAWYLWF